MTAQAFTDLLTELHASLDRLAEDLQPDRPELAAALRRQTAWIPRPSEARAHLRQIARRKDPCATLGPLLYHALDHGVLDARGFDALMIRRTRAARILAARRPCG